MDQVCLENVLNCTTDADDLAPNGAAHGLRQSSRHAPHAQYGGHVSQILGCLCCLDMGWYISMATSRLRSPCKCGYVFSMHRVHVVVIVPMHPVRVLNEVCVCSRLDGCHVCGHHGAPELRALHRTGMFSLGVEVHQKKEILWSPRT